MSKLSQTSQIKASENEKKLDFPYLAVIPYPVMIDKDITPNAKLHFGCLVALSKKVGYCYASDKQLSEMHGVSEREIKRWHKSLEDQKHIRRTSKNKPYRNENGKMLWKPERKIYVNEGFSNKDYEGDKNVTFNESDKNDPCNKEEIYKDKKEIYKESGGIPPASNDAPPKKISSKNEKEKKKEVADRIWLTQSELKQINERFGDKETKEYIEDCSLWKKKKGIEKRGSDYRTLINWAKQSIQTEKAANSIKESVEDKENLELAHARYSGYLDRINDPLFLDKDYFILDEKYIINNKTGFKYLRSMNKFKEILSQQLRLPNHALEGIFYKLL